MVEENKRRLHAVVEGRVQGVGFRYFVLERAQNLGLTGWVRNTFGGQVEILAEGNRAQLEELLVMLKKGPPSAWVRAVDQEWSEATGQYPSFKVTFTF
jgi:acylphosphatase